MPDWTLYAAGLASLIVGIGTLIVLWTLA